MNHLAKVFACSAVATIVGCGSDSAAPPTAKPKDGKTTTEELMNNENYKKLTGKPAGTK